MLRCVRSITGNFKAQNLSLADFYVVSVSDKGALKINLQAPHWGAPLLWSGLLNAQGLVLHL